jgi:hypothetical protein
VKRRGVVMLAQEDIHRLLKLGPGEHVSGVLADSVRDAILIRIDGDETSDLPECADGTYPMYVERPFAMVDLRRRLLMLLETSEVDPIGFVADLRAVLREELLS